jgi:hypothetical protein
MMRILGLIREEENFILKFAKINAKNESFIMKL